LHAPRARLPAGSRGQSSAKTRTIDGYEIAVLDHRPAEACGCPESAPPTGTPTPPSTGTGGQATPSPTPTVAGGASTTPARGRATPAPAATQPTDAAPANPATQPDCYKDHRDGVCACDCCAGSEWVLLAKLMPPAAGSVTTDTATVSWNTDYSVRRFIRPKLLPDPKLASAA
jgi:hypothetical protein